MGGFGVDDEESPAYTRTGAKPRLFRIGDAGAGDAVARLLFFVAPVDLAVFVDFVGFDVLAVFLVLRLAIALDSRTGVRFGPQAKVEDPPSQVGASTARRGR